MQQGKKNHGDGAHDYRIYGVIKAIYHQRNFSIPTVYQDYLARNIQIITIDTVNVSEIISIHYLKYSVFSIAWEFMILYTMFR